MARLNRNPSLLAMKRYLEEKGYPFEPHHGTNHPYLLVNVGVGLPIRVFFPNTGSDRRGADNSVRSLKRLIRERLEGRGHAAKV